VTLSLKLACFTSGVRLCRVYQARIDPFHTRVLVNIAIPVALGQGAELRIYIHQGRQETSHRVIELAPFVMG
jgi:hypothetical protein